MRSTLVVMLVLGVVGCSSGPGSTVGQACDPSAPNSCEDGWVCVPAAPGSTDPGVCTPVADDLADTGSSDRGSPAGDAADSDLSDRDVPAADGTGPDVPAADGTGPDVPAADVAGPDVPASDGTGAEVPDSDVPVAGDESSEGDRDIPVSDPGPDAPDQAGDVVDEADTVPVATIAKVVTALEGTTLAAGETLSGFCDAIDTLGNAMTGVLFIVESPVDLTVNQSSASFTVTGTRTGSYEITCLPADGAAVTLESATLTIVAGPAASLQLRLAPDKPVYRVADQVSVAFDLVDEYGNPVPGGAITVPTVDPVEGVSPIGGDRFQFDQEGQYVFSACDATNAALCDDVTGWCDGTAPTITITFPERGATLDGERLVVVTGTVTDAVSPVGTLTINGQGVPVGTDGAFQFPMEPGQGLNRIDATAADTFGNSIRTLRSYLFSNQWYTMDQPDPLASAVPEALKAYLDDTLFWSADATDEATISAILAMALADLDITALVPSPVTRVSQSIGLDTCGYDIYLDALTFADPVVKIAPDVGSLKLNIRLPNLYANLRLDKIDGGFLCPGDQVVEATADMVTLDSTVMASVDPVTHLILMSASEAELTLDGFNVDVENGFYDFIVGLLKRTIENMLKDQVKTLLTDQINKLPETLNALFAKPFEVAVPELLPGMNAVTLRISIQPEALTFDTAGGALDLNTAITSDHTIDRQILGSIGYASCLSPEPDVFGFDLANPEKLLFAVFDDVLNEAFYSLWNGRFLNIHLEAEALKDKLDLSQYGVENLDATTAALIPPVLSACNPNGTLTAQVGDLYLEASFVLMGEPVDLHTFLFLEIEMELGLADDPEKGPVVSITIKGPPKVFDMDVVFFESTLTQEEVTGLITGLIPVVFEQLKDPITVAIPSFNLKGLLGSDGSVPITLPDKDLVIVPKVLQHTQGYLNAAAGLELRDPIAPLP